jgi:carbonic anhydrase
MSVVVRSILAAAAAFVVCSSPAWAADAPKPAHWDYRGSHGVAHWAQLDAGFEACSSGHRQSPIDIRHATAADLPALEFGYQPTSPAITNNGHTVQVNVPAGQFLTVGGQRLELLQFHFHTPSEERLNGKASAMVAHLVHRDTEGHLAVVAVLLEPGRKGSAFDTVLEHLPRHAGETLTVADFQLDLQALLPKDLGYYDFEGSLTTPPCSEGVHWMVLREAVKVQPRHIQAFRQLYAHNARPAQALWGRDVKVSK